MPSLRFSLIYLVLGAATNLAFAPLGLSLVAFVIPTVVLLLLVGKACGHAFFYGFLYAFAYLFGSGYWIYYSLHDFGHAPWWVAILLVCVFSGLLALGYAVVFWIIRCCAQRTDHCLVCILVFPGLWLGGELFRSYFWVGFPLNVLGQALIDTPFIGLYPVFGIFGGSAFILFCSGCLGAAWLSRGRLVAVVWVAILGVVSAGVIGLGKIQWSEKIAGSELTVSVIQPNFLLPLKFNPEHRNMIIKTYISMSERSDADLIVWPETALPFSFQSIENTLLPKLSDWIKKKAATLLAGIFFYDAAQDKTYNAAFTLPRIKLYYKRRLVPFGEYMPWRWMFGFLEDFIDIPQSDLSSGEGALQVSSLMEIGDYLVGVTICYEAAFARDGIVALPDAHFLVILSNDSWFGNSAASYQFLDTARIRALESGRYIVRATNTGVSAVIGPDGRVHKSSGLFKREVLDAQIAAYTGQTPFARWGNATVLGFSISLLVMAFILAKSKQAPNRNQPKQRKLLL